MTNNDDIIEPGKADIIDRFWQCQKCYQSHPCVKNVGNLLNKKSYLDSKPAICDTAIYKQIINYDKLVQFCFDEYGLMIDFTDIESIVNNNLPECDLKTQIDNILNIYNYVYINDKMRYQSFYDMAFDCWEQF